MTLAVSVVLDRVSTTLLDSSRRAWLLPELLDYLNATQRAIVQVKADAFTKLANHSLAAGVDQTLPADGLSVINVYRNVASKKACKQVGLDIMNSGNPNWPADTPKLDVREWISDQRDPRRFMVSPPNTGAGVVALLYGATPAVVTAASDNISLPDSYDSALWAGVLSMAYAKQSTTYDPQKAGAYMQMMLAFVTGKTATIKMNAPDLKQVEQAQS